VEPSTLLVNTLWWMDPISEADQIVGRLRAISAEPVDPAPIIRTQLPFYGVKVSELRRIASGWHGEHPGATPAEIAAVADALWTRAVREEMVVAALILGRNAASRSAFDRDRLDGWTPLLDNWETTDQLGMALLGPWVGDDPGERFGVLEALAGDRHPWARRVALVGASRLSRLDDAGPWFAPSGALVLRLAGDREAAIPKAISWVLREHTRQSPAGVARFIDDHAAELPAIAVRETRKKLASGRKTGSG